MSVSLRLGLPAPEGKLPEDWGLLPDEQARVQGKIALAKLS